MCYDYYVSCSTCLKLTKNPPFFFYRLKKYRQYQYKQYQYKITTLLHWEECL